MGAEPDARAGAPGPGGAQAARLRARAWFFAPSFVVFEAGQEQALLVHDLWSGAQLTLEGGVREALLHGRVSHELSTLAQLDPALASLADGLQASAPLPLSRASLLRGQGYAQLFIELTARCNERCTHCYAESSPEREEALDAPTVRAVIEDAAKLGFARVQLTGGDPLVSPLCVSAAELAVSLGVPQVELYTNGLLLHGKTYERLRALEVSFAFSFYSHVAETHDAITRTPGSQRKTLAAIERVVRDGAPVRVNVVVMDQNHAELAGTIEALRALGLPDDAIGVDVQRSVGRGLMTIRPKDSGAGALLPGHRSADASFGFGGRAAVTADGSIVPCIFSRRFVLGRVPEQRLADVLCDERPLVVDVRSMLGEYSRREAALACWDCRLRAAVLASAGMSDEPDHERGAIDS